MKSDVYIAYYRVSTSRQGASGLGLGAQKKAVSDFLEGRGKLLGEYKEVESGKKSARPQLEAALKQCKRHGATLIIAKLDRLARNVHFVSGLMESKARFIAVDMPEANELVVHIMAAFAEFERKQISERTKAGLAQAKARGVKLGRHGKSLARMNKQSARDRVKELRPVIREIQQSGKRSVRAIADELNSRRITAARGGKWHPQTVNTLLHRMNRARSNRAG